MRLGLQNSASIQPRTSPLKFGLPAPDPRVGEINDDEDAGEHRGPEGVADEHGR